MVTVAMVSWRPGGPVTVATWTRVGTRVVCPRVTPMGGGPAPWWRGPSAPPQRGRVVTPSAGSDAKYFPLMLNIFWRTDQACGHVISHGVRGQDDEIMQHLT